MSTTILRKQFIMDAQGRGIGVILPIDDYKLVEPILCQHERRNQTNLTEEEKLRMIEQAVHEPLFLSDLQETMSDFSHDALRFQLDL